MVRCLSSPLTVVHSLFPLCIPSQKQEVNNAGQKLHQALVESLSVNIAVNSAANVLFTGEDGKPLHRPKIVGSATEGALLLMIHSWGLNFTSLKNQNYNKDFDKVTPSLCSCSQASKEHCRSSSSSAFFLSEQIYPFNSGKKRATAIIKRSDGSVRVLIKGATEWVLNDCTKYTLGDGSAAPLGTSTRNAINDHVVNMADRGKSTELLHKHHPTFANAYHPPQSFLSSTALRTLCIAHRDFAKESDLPAGWEDNPPDHSHLTCDGIVGIIDPLRGDVNDAVRTAQKAGVMVRMITGDNINTAKAIARVSIHPHNHE